MSSRNSSLNASVRLLIADTLEAPKLWVTLDLRTRGGEARERVATDGDTEDGGDEPIASADERVPLRGSRLASRRITLSATQRSSRSSYAL